MIVRAKYALIAPGEVRRDVRLEIGNSNILSVSSGFSPYSMRADYDFEDAVITPGLINPHCHLELEFCRDAVEFGGSFVDWLQTIRDLKNARKDGPTINPRASMQSMVEAGCTTVLDHHTIDLDFEAIESFGMRYFPFAEFFKSSDKEPDRDYMRSVMRGSYAPHAPYTSGLQVAKICRELADEAGLPMSVHISEFRGEIEFIRTGKNMEIQQLLTKAEAYDGSWQGTGRSSIGEYAHHGLLNRNTYAIHCNYLEPGDLALLTDLQPTVVYCPKSHAYFQHDAHPIEQLIETGVPVALGTDSLASNDQLSPLAEAALVRRLHPQIPAEYLFSGITDKALAPLGWTGWLGKLLPGYQADFAVFELDGDPGADFTNLFDAITHRAFSSMTVIRGKPVFIAREMSGKTSKAS